jgi:A/G-specific adenine glycosylase
MSKQDSIKTDSNKAPFQAAVWGYYHEYGRHDLPWRQCGPDGNFDPYRILVSELMLQQTQVARVIPKYQEFVAAFPTVVSLAEASLGEVLRLWSGLGYNRRAKFLHQAAGQIVRTGVHKYAKYAGQFPDQANELMKLPGVGPNTAGAILAYAFNQPVVFVETNIRTVFIHHFFADDMPISDQAIIEQVRATLDRGRPREWYWALMDYGSYLKQTVGNLNRQSTMYTKQSSFQGSRRQLRGQVIRLLGDRSYSIGELRDQLADPRSPIVLDELVAEHLIRQRGADYLL